MNLKNKVKPLFALAMLLFLSSLSACFRSVTVDPYVEPDSSDSQKEYGVFVEGSPENFAVLLDYTTVVLDTDYYSKTDIEQLRRGGTKVYAYLNIGSVEESGDGYEGFVNSAMEENEGWVVGDWTDVSEPVWWNYIDQKAGELFIKGVDGFFVDNTDVYDEHHEPEIFEGLVEIVRNLQARQKDIIINGGNLFVEEAVLTPKIPQIRISGVNQEGVFSRMDHESFTLTGQDPEKTKQLQNHLNRCAAAGLSVYMTEYADPDDGETRKEIENYCTGHGFTYCILDYTHPDDF